MDKEQIRQKRCEEERARLLLGKTCQARLAERETALRIGPTASHRFDIYEPKRFIGGISTSPWIVGHSSNNTGGQDRVSTELLWLSLWEGDERRVMVLTNREMATRTFERWEGCPFRHPIDIIFCDLCKETLETIGSL